MEEEYYKDARKWYNSLYVDCACERITYFIIFISSLFCLYKAYSLVDVIKKNKSYKNTYILETSSKNKDEVINIRQLKSSKNSNEVLLEEMIKKYIINMESLQYDGKEITGIDAIRRKSIIVKNLSNQDVYNDYISKAYTGENSDISIAILKQQRIVKIENIEFIYEEKTIFGKISDAINNSAIPIGAKIEFSTETTSGKNKKKKFIATMFFNFFINLNKKKHQRIEFNVNSYIVEGKNEISSKN